MTATFTTPTPRPAVAAPDLVRPDWTQGAVRDPALLWLDKNENTDPTLADVVAGVVAALGPTVGHSYPESTALYAKLASHTGADADQLLLSAGSDGAIRAAFEAFVSPGDAVVHTQPTFAMYAVYCKIYGAHATPVTYAPSNQGPVLDVDALIETIRSTRPRLVCLANPDSPTGTVLAPQTLRRVADEAAAAGAVMLIDEAYYPFYGHTALPWTRKLPNLMVTRSTGKAWGLAGFRIGYACAHPDLARILHKVKAMYETGTIGMAVFEGMLDHPDAMRASVTRLETGKAAFLSAMDGLGFATLAGHGNFCHVAFADKADAVHAALRNVCYYRQDFNDPCLKGFSRFSTTTEDRFRRVIDAIRDAART